MFSIVIPALNEEAAVTDILRRSLAAADKLRDAGIGVDDVEILLVNDGSRDRTEELARAVPGVRVLTHEVNRGYGAAIKTGFDAARGELLGFLDADGTCDPDFFVDLIRLMRDKGLDVALGSRMHPGSEMPAVRVLGNQIFRTLVNVLGSTELTDVASGMRVLRRDALARVYPLPDGLNFTPAMSARAALDRRLRLGELPMPYKERVGRSKLSVVKDGLRFLGIILDTAITFRPALFLGGAGAVFAALSFLSLALPLGAPAAPLAFYLDNRRLEDWMIFRVILATLLGSGAGFLAGLGSVAQSLVAIINEEEKPSAWAEILDKALGRRFLGWGLACLAASVWLNRRLLVSYLTTGAIPNDYWVFPLAGSLFALLGLEFTAFALVGRIARLLAERERVRKA